MDRKADLHVHSKYSKRPSEWVLRKIGCAESYTEPLTLYATLKQRGMSFVTVTDHNTLAGSLEIAHLSDAFVSEEITTYFPEDGCKLHALAYDITEGQHEDITRLRRSIFDLVPYLVREHIVHTPAHPLFSVNDRLTPDHVAKAILLTDARMNELMKEPGAQSEEIFSHFVNQVSSKVLKHFADSILDNLVGADLFDIFNTIGSAASLYTMLAPYHRRIHPFCKGDDLAQVYASSDLFVFPSATDTFGNVVLEAEASGIPAVVTDHGGPKENIIPNKTGVVVPAGDVEGFVNTLVALGNIWPRLKAMGEDARRYMENRTSESSYLQLWEIYRAADPHHAFLS